MGKLITNEVNIRQTKYRVIPLSYFGRLLKIKKYIPLSMAYISSGLERKVIRTDAEKVISSSMNTNAKTYWQTNNVTSENTIKSVVDSNILTYLLFTSIYSIHCSFCAAMLH